MRTAKKYRAMALAAMAADPGHPWHGTYAGYTYGCRCEKCRAAAREHRLAFRARESDRFEDDGWRYHGTITGYTYGCRCDRCRAAGRAYRAARKEKS